MIHKKISLTHCSREHANNFVIRTINNFQRKKCPMTKNEKNRFYLYRNKFTNNLSKQFSCVLVNNYLGIFLFKFSLPSMSVYDQIFPYAYPGRSHGSVGPKISPSRTPERRTHFIFHTFFFLASCERKKWGPNPAEATFTFFSVHLWHLSFSLSLLSRPCSLSSDGYHPAKSLAISEPAGLCHVHTSALSSRLRKTPRRNSCPQEKMDTIKKKTWFDFTPKEMKHFSSNIFTTCVHFLPTNHLRSRWRKNKIPWITVKHRILWKSQFCWVDRLNCWK